jgi:hypothetical protein
MVYYKLSIQVIVRAFVWDFEGSQRVPYVPNGVPSKIHECMKVETSSNMKFFKLCPREEKP